MKWMSAALLWLATAGAFGEGAVHSFTNRPPLRQKAFFELPLGAIRANGWLAVQLDRMRTGLTGDLDERYEAVVGPRNGWLGGDGDGWERGP